MQERHPTDNRRYLRLLVAFAEAWNRHDLDTLMSCMTADCVFEASTGPEQCGRRHEGTDAVRRAYADIFAAFPDAAWLNARHAVSGDRGFSEWTFSGRRPDGVRVEEDGCDLFVLRDAGIAVKSSFRKNRTG